MSEPVELSEATVQAIGAAFANHTASPLATQAEISRRHMPEWLKNLLPWALGCIVALLVATAGDLIRFGTFQRDFRAVQEHQIEDEANIKTLQQEAVDNQKAIQAAIEHGDRAVGALESSLPIDYVPRKEHVEKDALREEMEQQREHELDGIRSDLNTLMRQGRR